MSDDVVYLLDIFDPHGDRLVTSVRLSKNHVTDILRYFAPADDPEMKGAAYPIEGFFGARAIRLAARKAPVTARSTDKAPSHK